MLNNLGETFPTVGAIRHEYTRTEETIVLRHISCDRDHMCYLVALRSYRQVWNPAYAKDLSQQIIFFQKLRQLG